MKIVPALLAAFLITAVVGAAMLVVGGNALFNQNTIPVTNSPQSVSAEASGPVQGGQQAESQQIQQLQNLVQQYQQREKQYQTQLNDAAQRLNQDNQQLQSYQQLIDALQQQGIIRITTDGQVLIPRARFSDDDGSFGSNR
jgi:uncharacterized protein with von Willebrand factor type A (vWA) domain